jgi:uncharacterized membrane protein HdeD (DUF308 family)
VVAGAAWPRRRALWTSGSLLAGSRPRGADPALWCLRSGRRRLCHHRRVRVLRRWYAQATVAHRSVLGILFGIVALFWPGLTALALLYLVAFWGIFSGIARIVMAIMLRREIENEWSIALSGVLSVILGIVLILLPGAGLLAYTWLIGVLALAVGFALIYYAFRVRGQWTSGSSRAA